MKSLHRSVLIPVFVLPNIWGLSTLDSTLKLPHVPIALGNAENIRSSEVCASTKCVEYSKYIKDSLASNYTAINPCVDFDKYSCDGWRATHDYRPDQASVSITTVLSDTIRDLLHSILEGQYAENTTFTGTNKTFDVDNFHKMKMAYSTCMNENAIKSYGVRPIQKILDEFETVYPVKGSTARRDLANNELTRAVSWLSRRDVAGLVGAGSTADDMNPDTVVILMGAGEIQLAKQYYNKSAVLANYTRAIAEMMHVVWSGQPIDETPIPSDKNTTLFEKAQRIVNFEKKISEKVADPEQTNNIQYYYSPKTLAEIEKLVPEISVINYLDSLAPKGYSINANRTVIVGDIDYYKNLSSIIQTTPRETLHDYFQWRLVTTWSSRLHRNYSAPVRRFNNRLAGKEPDAIAERWRTCLIEVDTALGHLLGSTFIQRAFTKKDKELGDQIIEDVKQVFKDNLKQLDWMSEHTKEIAAKKVVNIIQKVGFQTRNPNEESPQELNAYYSTLSVRDNHFENGLSYLQFSQNKSWHDLLKPTDRYQWGMTSPTVNAYYNPPLNEIVFPAGIMQMPMFSGELPEYVSYGGFGATAGHELTHGFDDNGSKYDTVGRYREWWDNSTTVRFENKTGCFVKQYSQYTVEGLDGEKVPINGKLTLGENIADAGGLNAAYRAWKKRDIVTPNPGIQGLEKFTNDQLFFISYANGWCGKMRKEAQLQLVYSNPHPPDDKRIIGPVENSPDFRKAFNCPVKEAKCDLW